MSGLDIAGVVVAGVHLLELTSKIIGLIHDIQDAPESIRNQSAQLRMLEDVAKHIENNPSLQTDNVKSILESCHATSHKLLGILEELSAEDGAGKARRTWKAIDSVRHEKPIYRLFDEIERHKTSLALFIQNDTSVSLKFMGDNFRKLSQGMEDMSVIQAIVHNSAASYQLTEKQWNDYCLSALFVADPTDDRSRLITTKGRGVEGTCQWITTTETYRAWLSSAAPPIMWLSGGPGKGKTMLSIFLTHELERIATQSTGATVSYFFCENGDSKRNTAVSILRGLIWQLIQQIPKLSEYLIPSFKVQKERLFRDDSFETLWRIFCDVIEDPAINCAYCVLDGLDECDEPSLEILCKKLQGLLHHSPPSHRLKLIIVSREIPDYLSQPMAGVPRIRLDSDSDRELSRDLNQYIAVKVQELVRKKRYSADLRTQVECNLQEQADGTFLWVACVAESLSKVSRVETEACLRAIPLGLEGMYERMLLQVGKDRRGIVALILQWVTLALSPLTLDQLGQAIGVKPTVSLSYGDVLMEYIGFCGYLITVDGENVRLVHKSARDYLLRNKPYSSRELDCFRIDSKKANYNMARVCLQYLRDSVASGLDRPGKKPTFLSYASEFWSEHARNSAELAGDLVDILVSFPSEEPYVLEPRLKFLAPYQSINPHYWPRLSLLHIVSCLGIVPLAERIVKHHGKVARREILKHFNVDGKNPQTGLTALHCAAMFGRVEMMQWLLRQKKLAKLAALPVMPKAVELNAKSDKHETPLHIAVSHGEERMVQFLLENHAKVNTRRKDSWSPLREAVATGHEGITRLLLEHGAVVNEIDAEIRETPLHFASRSGNHAVMEVLLKFGANANAVNSMGRTPLHNARSSLDDMSIVQLLLDHGAKVDAVDRIGETPLRLAISPQNQPHKVHTLLKHGANPNATTYRGETPFHLAITCQNEAMMRLLLDFGADVNFAGDCGTTPLELAAKGGVESVLQLLLDHGVDVNTVSAGGATLFDLSSTGHQEATPMLQSQDVKSSTDLKR